MRVKLIKREKLSNSGFFFLFTHSVVHGVDIKMKFLNDPAPRWAVDPRFLLKVHVDFFVPPPLFSRSDITETFENAVGFCILVEPAMLQTVIHEKRARCR